MITRSVGHRHAVGHRGQASYFAESARQSCRSVGCVVSSSSRHPRGIVRPQTRRSVAGCSPGAVNAKRSWSALRVQRSRRRGEYGLVKSLWGDVGAVRPREGPAVDEELLEGGHACSGSKTRSVRQGLKSTTPTAPSLKVTRIPEASQYSALTTCGMRMARCSSSGAMWSRGSPAFIRDQFPSSSARCSEAHSLISRSAVPGSVSPAICWPIKSNAPCRP